MSKILKIVSIFGALVLFACCRNTVQYDFDKQDEFVDMFSVGMSRQEVEEILEPLESVSFYREQLVDNDRIVITYFVSSQLYGSPEYKFYFTNEWTLLDVVPVILTD